MNSVQQQHEHHHQKVFIESFHLSGHTFRFRWTVLDLEVFLGFDRFVFGSEGLKYDEFLEISIFRFFYFFHK